MCLRTQHGIRCVRDSFKGPSPMFWWVVSTGRRNIVEAKIDYRPISQRFRDGKKAAKKMSLWDSWLRWDSLKAIGRVFGKPSSLFIAA